MRLRITVETLDGRRTVAEILPVDVLRWERKYKTKISAAATSGLGIEDLAYLAHGSLRRTGEIDEPSVDVWIESVASIEPGDDTAVPTEPDRSAG